MTELFVEGTRIDISEMFSTLLTYKIDDIRDKFGARNASFSKTMILPGTANNNQAFGLIFDVKSANPYNPAGPNILSNFNAAKGASAILFQENIQVFKGVFRLTEIVVDNGRIEYEGVLFGELTGLVSSLANKKLEELDFSSRNHTYNLATISGSWDNWNAGAGVYYPLIDHGGYSTDKKNWDYRTFRPALFLREYIDKIFSSAGYRWSAPLFDTERFKSLIIPYNQAKLRGDSATMATVTTGTGNVLHPPADLSALPLTAVSGADFSIVNGNVLRYNAASPKTGDILIQLTGIYYSNIYPIDVRLGWAPPSGPGNVLAEVFLPATGGFSSVPFSLTLKVDSRIFATGDNFAIDFQCELNDTGDSDFNVVVDSGSFKITATGGANAELSLGNPVPMNAAIPKGILQVDLLASVMKLWNLYLYEDPLDSRKILATPFVDYYQTDPSSFEDWSGKIDRSRPTRIKPMSELNSRYYDFKMKQDSDYYNDLYNKRYQETYGSRRYDSGFEMAKDATSVEVIFAGTPLVGYQGEAKVYSTIFKKSNNAEEPVDSVIRILQAKKITGVPSWNIVNGATNLGSFTVYGYAGHLNSPDAPANDIQFGTPKELFFTLAAGALNVNQFNVYWSPYMAEITNKDSKLLQAWIRLTRNDVANLDFSRLKWIDGALFRLNVLQDWNANREESCQVSLLRVIDLLY